METHGGTVPLPCRSPSGRCLSMSQHPWRSFFTEGHTAFSGLYGFVPSTLPKPTQPHLT